MKKTKLYILFLSVCLIFTMTGCSSSDKREITETVEAFLGAAENTDYDTVSDYCSENVLSSMGLTALNIADSENHYYEHQEIDRTILSEETQKAVTDYYTFFAQNLIQDYSITEVTYQDGIGTVNATITTFSREATDYMASEAFRTELSDLMNSYQTEHLEELSSIYMKDGEEAMQQAFYNAIIPLIMEKYKSNYDNYESDILSIVLNVEKVNDTWKITDAYLDEK